MDARRWVANGCMLVVVSLGVGAPQLIADPPARVGRLDFLQGVVSFRPAAADEWAAAELNRPVTTGDRVWTDVTSRAELHLGSTAVRLAAQTELDIVNLDDETFQARLAQGSMTIRIRTVEGGAVNEIDTPSGAVTFGQAGEYRIDVDTTGTMSRVTVWSGGAVVTSTGSSFQVHAEQLAVVNGVGAPTYNLTDAPAYDDWDNWCVARDRREDASRSAQYVSREMPGYDDLDAYGHWTFMAGYGNVWVPDNVGPDWAPYHTGRWVWIDPWGWSWVDTAPWGYAPYHYGRWAYAEGSWFWVPGGGPPGVVVEQGPVYAPALVAFVGGPGWGVAVGGGGGAAVAWVALGPGEPYRPAYAASPAYVERVNVMTVTRVTNVTNITTYRNAGAPGAVAAMSQTGLASGRPVAQATVPVSRTQLMAAPVAGGAPPVAPTRFSVGAGAGGGLRPAAQPPAAVFNRAVVARTPAPPAPVPFAQQQALLSRNGGRPLEGAQLAQARQTMPAGAAATTLGSTKSATPATTTGSGAATAGSGLARTPATGVRVTGTPGSPGSSGAAAMKSGTTNGAPGQGNRGVPPRKPRRKPPPHPPNDGATGAATGGGTGDDSKPAPKG